MKQVKLAEALRSDYVQTAIMLVITIASVVAFWYGLRSTFKTEHPLLAVASGSMVPTLKVGDLIVAQGVLNACEIKAASKDASEPGDIIIFKRPIFPHDLIVHRAVEKNNEDGLYYFRTQGDAVRYQDRWKVKETDIVGKYTGVKVPLLGHIALFFEPLHVKLAFILLWTLLLILLEIIPLSRKHVEKEQGQTKPL